MSKEDREKIETYIREIKAMRARVRGPIHWDLDVVLDYLEEALYHDTEITRA